MDSEIRNDAPTPMVPDVASKDGTDPLSAKSGTVPQFVAGPDQRLNGMLGAPTSVNEALARVLERWPGLMTRLADAQGEGPRYDCGRTGAHWG